MGLRTTPQILYDERQFAVFVREELLAGYDDQIARFHTSAHKGQETYGRAGAWDEPYNHSLDIVARTLPRIAGGVPQVNFSTPLPGAAQEYAKAQAAAANRDMRASREAKFREECGTDMLFKWTAAIVTEQPMPGHGDHNDPPNRPVAERVSVRDFFFDPSALTSGSCRYLGHDMRDDIDTLLDLAKEKGSGWNAKAIRAVNETAEEHPDDDRRSHGHQPDRHMIQYSQVWVPDATPESVKEWCGKDYLNGEKWDDEVHHGYVFTLARASGEVPVAQFIRDPYPYFGPADGPYAWEGIFVIPDDPEPLSLMTATHQQAETFNMFKKALEEAMESWKRIFAVASSSPDIADVVATTPSGEVVVLEELDDLAGKMISMELGGPSADMVTATTIAQDDLDRMLGASDAERGEVSGSATASENIIASNAAASRSSWVDHKFRGFLESVERKKAWYRHYSERVVYLVPGVGPAGKETAGILYGGKNPKLQAQAIGAVFPDMDPEAIKAMVGGDEFRVPFDELELSVDPFSLRHVDEGGLMQRAQMLDATLSAYGQMQVQFPWLPWEELYRRRFQLLGYGDLADQTDYAWAQEVAGMMMQQEPRAPQATGSPQPRFFTGGTPQIGAIGGGGGRGLFGPGGGAESSLEQSTGGNAGMRVQEAASAK